jgi:polyvinyl alcohol dehydrogenase (cytochrome)
MSLVTASLIAGAPAGAAGACAGEAGGGEWPSYGLDLSNTRVQEAETTIDAAKAAALTPRFVVSAAALGGTGWFQSTPVIADGCLYAATDTGLVVAVNADDGGLVWKRQYNVPETRLGGTIAGAVAVSGGRAFVHVSHAGRPFVAALDQFTGEEVWRTVVDTNRGSFINASPVLFDGMVFTGISGDEYVTGARGGYAILDQETGAILAKEYTIPDEAYEAGYWGGSIWASAVVDPASGSLFVGTGNPASHDKEHRYTNAILKIDVDADGSTFGRIVDAYKGNVDQYYPGLDQQPVCESAPDVEYGDAWSLTCLQLDVDFGASPNLFRDSGGELMVGGLQKSGVYHTVYADNMQSAWNAVVGTPCFVCNAASSATDGSTVYVAASQPGQLVALKADRGGYRWVHPIADVFHWQSVSAANGLVYSTDLFGSLTIVDAATGSLVAKRDMATDSGESASGVSSGGVSIARHKVYAAAAGAVVAYS